MRKTIKAADLFAGAGGASTGLSRACEQSGRRLDLLAVNHWPIAVETHALNHPNAVHLCEDLNAVNPRNAVPGGKLDLLLAGPECTHHSTARGGKPINDQSRASAWCILRWATALQIDTILIENVRELMSWAPLGVNGRPLKSRKGETFRAFIDALRSLGYRVDWKLLNAANHGDPTTRERLFIQARRGRRPIVWPRSTHSPKGEATLFGATAPWVPARQIIDWRVRGTSIFHRKRPLSPNTIQRIAAGLKKFGGKAAEPFLVLLRGTAERKINTSARSLDDPVPTLTAGGEHVGVCQPFIVPQFGEASPRSIDRPLGTITTTSRGVGLVQPFVLGQQSGSVPRSTDDPLPTIATDGAVSLVQPFILPPEGVYRGNAPRSVDDPLQTVTSRGGGHLVEPFIMSMEHGSKPPAFVVPTNHGGTNGGNVRAYPIDRPMPTITTVDAWAVIEPYLVKFYGNGDGAESISDPLDTVTSRDRFGLVEPSSGLCLDILFRMLQPHELAAAMSFPADYKFAGNREQKVKQIGNAWAVNTAEALCGALLEAC